MPLLALVAVSGLGACSVASGPTDDDDGKTPEKESVAFEESGTLELAPSELRKLHIKTKAGARIRLLLIGESGDGSLDHGEVDAGDDGTASVTLKAPSKPSAFHILASVGENASADLAIAVSELGFAKVRIQPAYGGIRQVGEWNASVSVGVDCAAALKAYPGDLAGSLKAKSKASEDPLIASIPVGPPLAIVARSGAIIWGCVEGKLTQPNAEVEIPLEVTDVPLSLGGARLELSLAFTPTKSEFDGLVAKAGGDLVGAAFPDPSEALTILDAMRDLQAMDVVADFEQHRLVSQLDTAVDAILAPHPARETMAGWLGFPQLGSPTADDLVISGSLVGDPEAPLAPSFEIDALGPVPGLLAGAPEKVALSWKGEPSDTIVAGGEIYFSPTRFVGALLAEEATLGDPTASTGAQALANAIDCAAIGQVASFAGCDESCSVALCEQAIGAIWTKALAVDDGLGSVEVAVSGTAKVDAMAVPIGLQGSWVGSMSVPGVSLQLGGDAVATTPPPP